MIENSGPISVSVVIPCYRCGETIRRAVESVAKQTAVPFEVLLVDDFSNDGTVAQLQALAHDYSPGWLRIICLTKNGGPGAARNAGVGQASLDIIAFLDSDDAWHPQKLWIQYKWMLAHPAVLLSGHRSARYDKNIQAFDYGTLEILDSNISAKQLLLSNAFSCRTIMFRRGLPILFDSKRRYMEDQWWLMQVVFSGYEIAEIKLPLAYTFKADYGDGGLSGWMWKMEKAELENYYELGKSGCISRWLVPVLFLYSLLKHVRRVIVWVASKFFNINI
jgi:glycosyltransferase involved in cell wall biosynthesis